MKTYNLLIVGGLGLALALPAAADETPKHGGTLTYLIPADAPPPPPPPSPEELEQREMDDYADVDFGFKDDEAI